ncbi:MAG: rubrerythrin family protein [Actinomycetota bacterium]|nr:rubrerythrin family protein [Actinomycetota bacterium]
MQETIKNLCKAFIGESQARNRYTFYAKVAKDEGFEQIAEVFTITADNEKQHAKWLFRLIGELKAKSSENLDEIAVGSAAPTIFGTTAENLRATIAGENYEYTEMYPEFADLGDLEGLNDIANRLRAIGKAESHHEDRFKRLLKQVEGETVFKKAAPVEWFCRECGYPHIGAEPPEKCPSCDHPRAFYQVRCEEY